MALGGLDKKYQEILETLQRGDGVTAEKLLVPLIKRFPQADGLKEALGHAQWLQGRRNAAVKTWREAHYEEPRNAVITSHLVQALMEIKDYDQAERIIRRTLSHQPGHSALQAQLARILEARAQPFDAVEAYLAAAQRDSKNPKLWMAVLQAALQAQDYPNARTAGETLFSISPTPGATRGLIDAYRHLGRPDLAAEVLATCLSRWPKDPQIDMARGELCLAAGQLADATSAFQRTEATDSTGALPAASVWVATLNKDQSRLQALSSDPQKRFQARKAQAQMMVRGGRMADGLRQALAANTEFAPDLQIDSAPWIEAYIEIARTMAAMAPRRRRDGGLVRPLLILGLPRSGSTLLSKLLFDRGLHYAGDTVAARKHARRFKQPNAWPTITAEALQDFGEAYGVELHDYAGEPTLERGPQWIIDKTPWNLEFLPILTSAPLGARTILLERDWRSTAISMLIQAAEVNRPHDISLAALGTAMATYIYLADQADQLGLIDLRLTLSDLVQRPAEIADEIQGALGPRPQAPAGARTFLANPRLMGYAHSPPEPGALSPEKLNDGSVDQMLAPLRDAFVTAAQKLGMSPQRLESWGHAAAQTGDNNRRPSAPPDAD